MSKLRPGRQVRVVAGDKVRDLKISWLTICVCIFKMNELTPG